MMEWLRKWLKIKIKDTHKNRLKNIDFKKQAEKLKAANPELPQPQKDAGETGR